mmetsp:Transcript_5856/g.23008  ORF Transcript_5856/g.23008 Transcript_5856/m.23008 type:complete len:234 (+) Transcript_5856:506-1207(+)
MAWRLGLDGAGQRGAFAHARAEVVGKGGEVGLHVAAQPHEAVQRHDAPLKVEIAQADRHAGLHGDLVGAGAPTGGQRPGAFRGDGQPEVFTAGRRRTHLRDGVGHQAVRAAAVHRDAAEVAHPAPEQRHAEQTVLAPEAQLQAERPFGQHADHEVPVGGVRVHQDDALPARQAGRLDAPAAQAQQRARHAARLAVGLQRPGQDGGAGGQRLMARWPMSLRYWRPSNWMPAASS